MKIDSFEIKFRQYLCVVANGDKRTYFFNLKESQFSASISEKKDSVKIFSAGSDEGIQIEADFDLSTIIDAFMWANIER
jgi:hypothetical protein